MTTWQQISWLVLVGGLLVPSSGCAKEPTYAERLGWPPGSKVVIFHVDDAGMSHDSNVGAIEAVEKGLANSMSIMFPCRGAAEIVQYLKEHPQVDAGVHITLTSEWRTYRWGPVAGKERVPGLVDPSGHLWSSLPQVAAAASADEVETEILAQLQRCRSMGLNPTHLDTHMGTVFARPDYFQKYVEIGIKNNIPIMLPAGHLQHLMASVPQLAVPLSKLGKRLAEKVWDAGLPVLDDLYPGDPPVAPEAKKAQIIKFLRTLQPGLTQLVVHCTRPSESFRSISGSGPLRLAELEAMLDPEVKRVVEEEKIILTNWRELKERRDKVRKAERAETTN
jgi:chitin disaccharide deacetylase